MDNNWVLIGLAPIKLKTKNKLKNKNKIFLVTNKNKNNRKLYAFLKKNYPNFLIFLSNRLILYLMIK